MLCQGLTPSMGGIARPQVPTYCMYPVAAPLSLHQTLVAQLVQQEHCYSPGLARAQRNRARCTTHDVVPPIGGACASTYTATKLLTTPPTSFFHRQKTL